MTFTSRTSFAAVLRRAIREGTLREYYRRDRGVRVAYLTDDEILHYEPRGYWSVERAKGDDDGREYADPRDAREERL